MKRATLLLLLLATSFAFADEDAAKYFTGRGQKALEEKDYAEAERQFTKALGEWRTHAPAVLGLAEVAIARNDTKQAISFLATCLKMRAAASGSKEGREAVERAEELLKKLDRPRFEYRELVDRYVTDLMKLANEHAKENADLARRCVERVLKVAPDHAGARALLAKVGPAPEPVVPAGDEEKNARQLFNGKDMDNWYGIGDAWRIADGIVTASTGGDAYQIRSKERAEGDYTLTIEMRVEQDTQTPPLVAMSVAYLGEFERQNLNVFPNSLSFVKQMGTFEDKVQLWRSEPQLIKGGFDRKKWNVYRFRIRKNRITVYINGHAVYSRLGEPGEYDGHVSITVQCCTAQFRKITLAD
jgi:tetratricopeptide (TPR) repeat protein